MNAPSLTFLKHWALGALLLLGLASASCSVPNFAFSPDTDAGTGSAHCSDLIANDGETGLDCGGTCPACPAGGTCLVNNDCLSNECISGMCQDASCTDGVQSGSETGVDCGGGACTPCPANSNCLAARDCASGVCTAGACAAPSCTDTLQNGDETDQDCGGSCPTCLPGQHCKLPTDCAGGACTDGTCSLTCLDGKGNCDGDASNGCETNLKTDADHCGACDTPCSLKHASALCNGGKCVVDKCTAPYVDCDGDPSNGCEVNTTTDPLNCGGCGGVCSDINGTPSCAGSKCLITCTDGFADCDDDRVNGCEINTDKNVNNCGKCGNICDATSGAAKCTVGVCGVSNCKAGLGDCDTNPTDCETDITTSVDNCGGCGVTCVIPNGVPACKASVCSVGSCNAGYADCNGDPKDGCETNIATDTKNCGACNTPCAISNATAACVNKVCKVSVCTLPFADCDGDGTTCETNTSTNVSNCGGCAGNGGVSCTARYPNATGKCVTGGCQIAGCATDFADCNMNPDLDGCEVNLKTSSNSCGVCGNACLQTNSSNVCANGTCSPTCNQSYYKNCDAATSAGNSNGCEVDDRGDPANCGGCGITCVTNATTSANVCTAAACVPTCTANHASCDSNPNNGCETTTSIDAANCGGCGKVCTVNAATTTNVCTASTCVPGCAANHANCDGNPNNGCETPTAADPANCGGCGTQCLTQNASASTCSAATCNPTCNDGFAVCSNPAAGCLTSIDTAAHCGNCNTACTGGTPFCVSRACAAQLVIGVVNSSTTGTQASGGVSLTISHTLQTSAAANHYRLVLVGVTGSGNNAFSLPAGVTYNGMPMTLARAVPPSNAISAAVYYITGANLPAAAGPYNVVVASSGSNSFQLAANVVELINVEQTVSTVAPLSPIDAVGGTASGSQCSTHTPSDAITVPLLGDLVYSVAGVNGTPMDTTPNTSGQVITEQTIVSSLGSFAGYIKNSAAGARTVTWTIASCSSSAHALVSVKPAVNNIP
jgi:hypothetical protein